MRGKVNRNDSGNDMKWEWNALSNASSLLGGHYFFVDFVWMTSRVTPFVGAEDRRDRRVTFTCLYDMNIKLHITGRYPYTQEGSLENMLVYNIYSSARILYKFLRHVACIASSVRHPHKGGAPACGSRDSNIHP
jgi:hypothetical protein